MSDKISFKFRTTIRARILRLSIISIIVVSATLVIYNSLNERRIMMTDYMNQTQNNADVYADSVQQWVKFIKQQIVSEAVDKSFVDTELTIEQRKKNLAAAADLSEFKDFSIANSDGTTYNDTDISDRDYFQNAMNGETYISSPVVRKTDGKLTIMAGTKVVNDEFDGVLYGGLDVEFFSGLIGSLNLGESGEGFIVDKAGMLVACNDMSLVECQTNIITKAGEDKAYSDWSSVVRKMINGERGNDTIMYVNGEKYMIGYSPIDIDEGWSIGIMIPYREVQLIYFGTISVGVLLTLILIFIAIFVDIFIANKIAKPIRDASLRIARLAEGDIYSEAPRNGKRGDETELLLTSLENTLKNLKLYIGNIKDILSSVAGCDLTVQSDVEYAGDFIELKKSLDGILQSLNSTFRHANMSAGGLAQGAEQVAQASNMLAQGATEQASAIEEITVSLSTIAEGTNDNAKDAGTANELVQTTRKEAEDGSGKMKSLSAAMKEINDSSEDISKIIKVIDDIAFQTNILALNASVEAARAGEHGKGFAVVAEEVRVLAGKVADAANETSELIEESIKKVGYGFRMSEETAASLEEIVNSVKKVAGLVGDIAVASSEQADSIKQVNIGITQISNVVQTNSATSEQCAASSSQLSERAANLRKQVLRYKIKR